MKERLRRRIGAEVSADAREPQEPEIDGEIRVAEQTAPNVAELSRRSAKPADDPDGRRHDEERRKDALGAFGVERSQ